MLLQLGNHIFEGLKAPLSLSETTTARWGKVPLVNGKDAIQHTGSELVEIEIEAKFDISFCVPQDEVNAIKQSQEDGITLPLTSGDGVIYGKFVITALDIQHETFSKKGRLESVSINIKLLESPYLDAETPSPFGARSIGSLGTNIDVWNNYKPPKKPKLSGIKSVVSDINKAKSKVAQIKSAIQQFKRGTTTFKRAVRDVRKCATDAKRLYTTAKTKAAVAVKIVQRAQHLPTSLDGAIRYAENLAVIDDVADMTVVERNVNALGNSAKRVDKAASPVVAMAASKEQD